MTAHTPKQRTFIDEYLIDLNATQAAKRAGYSAKTASEQGARLLANVKVRQAIDQALNARASNTDRQARDVLKDVQELAQTAKAQYMAQPDNHNLLNVALKALELESRHMGIANNVSVQVSNGAGLMRRMFEEINDTAH